MEWKRWAVLLLVAASCSVALAEWSSPLEEHMKEQTAKWQQRRSEDDPSNNCAQVPKELFSQQLDHFNYVVDTENNVGMWGQRYSVQKDWFVLFSFFYSIFSHLILFSFFFPFRYGGEGYPIFIFLGGEANMDFFCFQTVAIRQWAQQFKAL